MSNFVLDYDGLMQDALRCVVKDVLMITSELKETPGDHHFYIEFITTSDGVSLPQHLKEVYPERMTVVLHHQFENLVVTDKGFSVTLWFKGVEADLVIPFDSITSFADPSVKFGLRFQERDEDYTHELGQNSSEDDANDINSDDSVSKSTIFKTKKSDSEKGEKTASDKPEEKQSGETADVVSLDSFRKNK